MLKEIKRSNNWRETVDSIFEMFYKRCVDERIPALFDVGSIFGEEFEYEELYLKLVLVPKGQKITHTWIKDNLSSSSTYHYANDWESCCHNIIVQFNCNGVQKYGFNPILLSSEELIYSDFGDGDVINQTFNAYKRLNKPRILQKENSKEKVITLSFLAIEDLINHTYDDSFDLYADFEYRKRTNDYKGETGEFDELDGRYHITYDPDASTFDEKHDPLLWIQGSKMLDIEKLRSCLSQEINNDISVISLDSQEMRPLNPGNYNDDTNAGLVPFTNDAIDVLRKYYFVYGLQLIPKTSEFSSVLVDFLDNAIVFWEGEFNKFPEELKEALVPFNIKEEFKPFISEAMFAWQLGARFDFAEKESFYQQLADYYRQHYEHVSFENELSFEIPSTVSVFASLITKVLKIANIELEDLRFIPEKQSLFERVINNSITLSIEQLRDAYEGFSYVLLRYLNENK